MASNEQRVNPDELLKAIKREEQAAKRGHLKIFFGYAAGVGKTYAMLTAAHAAQARGIDVVVGYVEPHARPKTMALLEGLEVVPTREVKTGDITLREMDLDGVLERAPKLVLVDELAHTNAPGSRHAKRYQDVDELLRAGIDVYTTVNVQHIESLNDMVASVTGVIVRERIPDRVFDDADQVNLVDIEPQDLIDRLNAGEVYGTTQASRALRNFFTVENLTALREIALRRCADRVNHLSDEARAQSGREYYTDEHVLVGVSPSPSNPKIIRTAARMASAFHATLTALYVETPAAQRMTDEDKASLRQNINLAEQLGAHVETAQGEDVAFQLSEFARLSGVSKIVVGRSTTHRRPFGRPPLTERLSNLAPNLDVYIIPDNRTAAVRAESRRRHFDVLDDERPTTRDSLRFLGVLAATTLVCFCFDFLGFATSSVMATFMLGVVLVAVFTTSRLYALAAPFITVGLFNFCFVDPRFTLATLDSSYLPTYIIMFITSLIVSMLTTRINRHAKLSARTAYRTKVLFDTEQRLQQAKGPENISATTAQQLHKLLERDVVLYLARDGKIGEPTCTATGGEGLDEACVSPSEQAVAAWVCKNNKHAGATTSTLPDARCLYLAIRTGEVVYGVVGVVVGDEPLDAFENSIVLSILGECALALETDRASREREEAAVLARNEALRANLLRSIGHDLRTPLTSISGAAGMLANDGESLAPEQRAQLIGDIYDDALWLTNLVENLLAVTRLEDGSAPLHMEVEMVSDVVAEAVRHTSHEARGHQVTTDVPDMLMARMDARLIVQVLVNLIDNAVKYTPAGSTITVKARRRSGKVLLEVVDDGPGIPDADKPHVFDMFYTVAANKPVDGRRSVGFGLALCKSIVSAHDGTIRALDNRPHGTVIRIALPGGRSPKHE